jgi:hypothetical protein
MSQPPTIDQLRSARDTALAALKSSIDAIAKEIEVVTDPDEAALNQRLDNLVSQSDAIETTPPMPFSLYPRSLRLPPH